MRTRLLIVSCDAQSLRMLLNGSMYAVDASNSIAASLGLIRRRDYVAVLVDKNMPAPHNEQEGWKYLLASLRENGRQPDLVLLEDSLSIPSMLEALRLGATDVIKRPCQSEVIIDKLNRIKVFRRFINPECIARLFRNIMIEQLASLSATSSMTESQLSDHLCALGISLDKILYIIKSNESIILTLRESLAKISGLANMVNVESLDHINGQIITDINDIACVNL